jgi:hypothetical protein
MATKEAEQHEREIFSLVSDMITCSVNVMIYEEHLLELMMECEALEIRMITEKGMLMEEISTRDAYVDELHRRIATMGGENAELKADMSSYLPLVASLSAQISVLEEGTRLLSELNKEGKLVSCFICPSNCSIFHSPLICNMPFLIKTFTIVPVKQEIYFSP